MKDLSFFLKNSMALKMRKRFHNSCNSHASTSTLDQHKPHPPPPPLSTASTHSASVVKNNHVDHPRSVTLEEMILKLELEEAAANFEQNRRMSCVNDGDILRTARKALNQYPRFSLDGKDAMYRSSFRDTTLQAHCLDLAGLLKLPQCVGGESVVWCKPGAVAKLMGLDAIPVPIRRCRARAEKVLMHRDDFARAEKSLIGREDFVRSRGLRRRAERHEMERRMHCMDQRGWY
ncbi:hypothetical protein Droror1_Dr00020373 [Drosera rotundifolia]